MEEVVDRLWKIRMDYIKIPRIAVLTLCILKPSDPGCRFCLGEHASVPCEDQRWPQKNNAKL
jgi:hypothetical protein